MRYLENLEKKIHTIFPGDLVKFKKRMVSSGVMGSSLSWTYPKHKGYGIVSNVTIGDTKKQGLHLGGKGP